MLVAGVDDAGRGCVIGPLVIAGVMFKEEDLVKLVQLGAKDSKVLSPRKREVLAVEIKRHALKHSVIKLEPKEIDTVVQTGKKLHRLNRLEAQTMAKVIEMLKPDMTYVDASDVLEERFKQHILECLPFKVEIVSEHKADSKYPIVSAASIIAKVERDKEIEELIKQPDRLKEYGKKAREKMLKRYSWEKYLMKLIILYEETIINHIVRK